VPQPPATWNQLIATAQRLTSGERYGFLWSASEFVARRPALRGYEGRTVALGFRPEHLRAGANGGVGRGLRGSVLVVESLGSELLAHIEVAAEQVTTEAVLEGAVEVEERDALLADAQAWTSTVVGRFDPETRVRAGDTIDVAVNSAKLHVFDLDSGLAVAG
jgi:multiple sugar transport system ATP-binding protein